MHLSQAGKPTLANCTQSCSEMVVYGSSLLPLHPLPPTWSTWPPAVGQPARGAYRPLQQAHTLGGRRAPCCPNLRPVLAFIFSDPILPVR